MPDEFLNAIGVSLDPPVKSAGGRNTSLDAYQAQFDAAEKKHGLPKGLLRAVAAQESSGNPDAKSPKGALGLMQLLPETAAQYGADPRDPGQSIDAAGQYLKGALAKYNGDVPTALKSYHGGFDQSQWGPLTNAYAPAVLARMGGPAPAAGGGPDGFLGDVGVTLDPAQEAAAPAQARAAMPAKAPTVTVDQIAHGTAYAPGSDIQLPGGGVATVASVHALQPGEDPGPGYTKVQRNGQTLYVQSTPSERTADYPVAQPKDANQAVDMVRNALIPAQDRKEAAGANTVAATGQGLAQGVRDTIASIDPVAQWLASTPGGQGVDQFGTMIGLPSADQTHAGNVMARNQFDALYGDRPAAEIGRVGGNLLTSLPLEEMAAARLAPVARAMGPVGSFVSGGIANTASNPFSRGASAMTNQAVRGGAMAAMTSGASDAPVADQIRDGAMFGGALGGLGSSAFSAGRSVAAGSALGPETQALASRAMDDFGIKLRAGQLSGNRFLSTVDSVLNDMPMSGYAANSARQRDAFAKAVAGRFGEPGSTLTPATMAAAKARIGNVFDDVASKTTITGRDDLLTNLGGVVREAAGVLPEPDLKPLLTQVERIGSSFDPAGKMSGETYQALTRKGTPLDRLMQSSDPNIRYYAGQIRDALDGALQGSASEADVARLSDARRQYKNLKTVEALAAKASPEGDISPALLLNAVKKSYGDFAYGGGGDIGDLARIGQRFLKEPPNSGTAPRSFIQNALTAGGLVGGGAGITDLMMHDPGMALKLGALGVGGTIGTLGLTRGAGAMLDNPFTRSLMMSGARTAPDEVGPAARYIMEHMLSSVPSAALVGRNRLSEPQAAVR